MYHLPGVEEVAGLVIVDDTLDEVAASFALVSLHKFDGAEGAVGCLLGTVDVAGDDREFAIISEEILLVCAIVLLVDAAVLEMLLIVFAVVEGRSSNLLEVVVVVGTVALLAVGLSETCIIRFAFGATVRGGGVGEVLFREG